MKKQLSPVERYPELATEDRILREHWRLEHYLTMRADGQTHRFAAMCAAQQGPRVMTDVTFFEGQGTLDKQFHGKDKYLNAVIEKAKQHGYTPGKHDVYMPGLARFPGDPEAFVPPTGGRGYIKKLCEERGTGCEGAVNVAPRQDEPAPNQLLGADIVEDMRRQAIRQNPELAHQNQDELRQAIVDKHAYTRGDYKQRQAQIKRHRKRATKSR